MWSVWSEAVQVYVGHGLAMLHTKKQGTQVFEPPATWSLDRVLATLAQSMASAPQRRKFYITLGSAWCPPHAFALPPTVHKWSERLSMAQAHGATPDQTNSMLCEIDLAGACIAATLPCARVDTLQQWATQCHGAVASIQPLWAVASQSAYARQRRYQGICVQEGARSTVICFDAHGKAHATSLVADEEDQATHHALRRWLVAVGVSSDAIAHLAFVAPAQTPTMQVPKPWAAHWRTEGAAL